MIQELIHELSTAGIHVLPLRHRAGTFEHPPYSHKFDSGLTLAECDTLIRSDYRDGIAVMHGRCNPHIICLDFDEKNAPGKRLYDTWKHLVDEYLMTKLVIEKTRSGGYHIYFKCRELPTSKALANSESGAEWIACRSASTNCITYCAPSPGYTFVQGSLMDLQYIEPKEMKELCDACAQLNEYTGARTAKENYLTVAQPPIEMAPIVRTFDALVDSSWTLDYLLNVGWQTDGVTRKKIIDGESWQYLKLWRPGKDLSESASANYWINRKRLSVFTSSTDLPHFDSGSSFTHSPSRVIFYLNGRDWHTTTEIIKAECKRLEIELPQDLPLAYSMPVGKKEVWRVEIRGVIQWAERCGYRWMRLAAADDSILELIRVVDNVIFEADEKDLIRSFTIEIERNYKEEGSNRALIAFIPSMYKYMDALPLFDGELMRDTKEASYIYFSNGALKVTSRSAELIKYSDLTGCVFARHIKNFSYQSSSDDGVFGDFIQMVSIDEAHLKFIKSTLGYLLHYYKLKNYAKAVMIIEDVPDQEEARGRSGKGLIAQFVEWLRWTIQQDGRNFKSDSQFKMQRVVPGVQVYYLNDPAPGVIMHGFYNTITDDWQVEAKGKKSYSIPFRNSPKILITTNYLPNLESDSDKDRFIVLPIKKVFGQHLSLKDVFPDMIFFDEHWDQENRNGAVRFAIECLQLYLKEGVQEYVNEDMKRNADLRVIKNLVPDCISETFEQAMEVFKTAKTSDEFKRGMEVYDLRKDSVESLVRVFSWEPAGITVFVSAFYQYCLRAYQLKNMSDKSFGKRLRMYIDKLGLERIHEVRNNFTGRRFTVKISRANESHSILGNGITPPNPENNGTAGGFKPLTDDDLWN